MKIITLETNNFICKKSGKIKQFNFVALKSLCFVDAVGIVSSSEEENNFMKSRIDITVKTHLSSASSNLEKTKSKKYFISIYLIFSPLECRYIVILF